MYRTYVGRRVLVQSDDYTLDGTLTRDDKEGLTLDHVTHIAGDGTGKPVDGLVLVPHGRFDWIQVV